MLDVAIDASTFEADQTFEADVAIIGSGAGGGVTAEILAASGLKVIVLEEGPLKTKQDFRMLERDAYPQLYQEAAARKTKDNGITVLQGRAVGGTTTVNWTASFRTPSSTLRHWQTFYGLQDLTADSMAPWFRKAEKRLNIEEWSGSPNANNRALRDGAEKLGFSWGKISRNVKACRNLGYCGMGCPVGAKQSMLETTLPEAVKLGATLIHHLRVERLQIQGDRVSEVHCRSLDKSNVQSKNHRVVVRARHVVLSAGAIGSPAVLLRSGAPDPFRRVGQRTFLHPVVVSAAKMPYDVEASAGAPQSIYSDHFLSPAAHETENLVGGEPGFKLEVMPLHPVLAATTLMALGKAAETWAPVFNQLHVQMALVRDGFHPESSGGEVLLRDDGSPVLDYKVTSYLWSGFKKALLTMAELQFAAGAERVMPVHHQSRGYNTWSDARSAIAGFSMEIITLPIFSAHVMGGCAMGANPSDSVVNSFGRHHHLRNLSVIDGSVFPTSLGANPQLSIYGLAWRNAAKLAEELGSRR